MKKKTRKKHYFLRFPVIFGVMFLFCQNSLFQRIGPLGQFDQVVTMSICPYVCLYIYLFFLIWGLMLALNGPPKNWNYAIYANLRKWSNFSLTTSQTPKLIPKADLKWKRPYFYFYFFWSVLIITIFFSLKHQFPVVFSKKWFW